jgi:hypothetical protein
MPLPPYGSLPVVIDPTAWAGRTESASLTVDTIQNQIAAQLTSFFAALSPVLSIPIYVFPNFDLDTWWADLTKIAFVLISYSNTTFSKPLATSSMVQERTLQFKVHVEARQTAWALSGAGSVYALIDAIEAALEGFQPQGCRNAYFTEERFNEQDSQGRVWLYDMTLNVVTLRPKLLPQYALANLIKEIVNVQPSGDQVIVTPGQTSPLNGG